MTETIDLHQEVILPLDPHEVYETLLDSHKHSALTGLPCRIDRIPNGRFEVGDGMIEGTLLELIADQRIVQRWRIDSYGWPPSHFSLLQLELKPEPDGGTCLILNQTGVPIAAASYIEAGWYEYYWSPLGATEHHIK